MRALLFKVFPAYGLYGYQVWTETFLWLMLCKEKFLKGHSHHKESDP